MLRLEGGVLTATFAALRDCGGGERECVVYWLGLQDDLGRVDQVVQPEHEATPFHYEVSSSWLNQFFLALRGSGRCVRAQVHTHPGRHVEHSPTDDAFALAPSLGFISLVLPYFAAGKVTLEGAYAAAVTENGWAEVAVEDLIQWT